MRNSCAKFTTIGWIAIISALAGILVFPRPEPSLSITLNAPAAGTVQVVWRTRWQAYDERRAVAAALLPGENKVVLRIPGGVLLDAVRLNLIGGSGPAFVQTITLSQGAISKKWDLTTGYADWVPTLVSSGALVGISGVRLDQAEGRTSVETRSVSPVRVWFGLLVVFIGILVLVITRSIKSLLPLLSSFEASLTESHLITASPSAFVTVAILMVGFVLCTLLNINGSSVGYWSELFNDGTSSSVLAGHPRLIRADEWTTFTSWILSQVNHEPPYPLHNDAVGFGASPLLLNIPVAHVSTFFRPQLWGFFVLGADHGFAYFWGFRVFGVVLTVFLTSMLVTRNRFWPSLLCAGWFFFSGFTQWWLSTYSTDLLVFACAGFIAACYLLFSRKRAVVVAASFALLLATVSSALCVYPPTQISLLFLMIALMTTMLMRPECREALSSDLRFRLLCLTVVFFAVAFVGAVTYMDLRETIAVTQNTVYPGNRRSLGGELTLARYFTGFFSPLLGSNFINDKTFNDCEASGFAFFWPVALLVAAVQLGRGHKEWLSFIPLLAYLLLFSLFHVVGFGQSVAAFTLLNLVTGHRLTIGLGLANALVIAMLLSMPRRSSVGFATVAAVLFGIGVWSFSLSPSDVLPGRLVPRDVFALAGLLACVATYSLLRRNTVLLAFALAPEVFAGLRVNPISFGLDAIETKQVVMLIEQVNQRTSGAKRWLSYGDLFATNMLKASGAPLINGATYSPQLDLLAVLDPSGSYAEIYNRYAHVAFVAAPPGSKPTFSLATPTSQDAYIAYVDPCSEAVKRLNVGFIASYGELDRAVYSCLSPVVEKPVPPNFWVYELQG